MNSTAYRPNAAPLLYPLPERPRTVEWIDQLPASFRSEAFAEDLAELEPAMPMARRTAALRLPAVSRLMAVTWGYLRPALAR